MCIFILWLGSVLSVYIRLRVWRVGKYFMHSWCISFIIFTRREEGREDGRKRGGREGEINIDEGYSLYRASVIPS